MNYEITPDELKSLRDAGVDVKLVDVREPWEFAAAKIADSRHIPMNEIPARLQEFNQEQHVVVVCHHGVRSMSVTTWLRR